MMNPQLIPTLNRHFRLQWEPVQDAYVLLYPEGMVKLNHSAAEILRACNGDRTIAEISLELQQRYPEVEDIDNDIDEFFEGATRNGWTRCECRD